MKTELSIGIFFQISFTNSTLPFNAWYLAVLSVNFFTFFSVFCIIALFLSTIRIQTFSTFFHDYFFHCCFCLSSSFWLIHCRTVLFITAVKAVSFRSKTHVYNNNVISIMISFINWLIQTAVLGVTAMLTWTSLKFVKKT
jgi:hypothetical protein